MTVPEHPIPFERPIRWPSPSGRVADVPHAGVPDGAGPESVPRVWDESRDPLFFAITARLFPPAATLAMTVLLASHDADVSSTWARPAAGPAQVSAEVPAEVPATATAPLGGTARSDYCS